MTTQEMKPAEAIALLQREDLAPKQIDGITQQVLLVKAASATLNELRCLLARKNQELKRFGKAAALWRAVAATSPEDAIDARLHESECLVNAGEGAMALKALEQLPVDYQEQPEPQEIKGRALELSGRSEEAIACYEKVLRSGRIRESTLNLLVNAYIQNQRADEAGRTLEDVLKVHANEPPLWHKLAQIRLRLDQLEPAEAAARKALELAPENAVYRFQLAGVLQVLGRLDEAERHAERGLELAPADPAGLDLFGKVHRYTAGSPELSRLESAMAQLPDLRPTAQIYLLSAKAKALEDIGDVRAAFAHYATLGRLKLKLQPYSGKDRSAMMALFRARFTPEYVAKPRGDRCQSEMPVFVVGMPRSGTSLLEQVLSSHSAVAGIGEQKIVPRLVRGVLAAQQGLSAAGDYWPVGARVTMKERGEKYVEEARREAGRDCLRTVDKMPGNYGNIGPIFDMLPRAHIIHSMRHPIETCVSCYRILFGEGHLWSYDLKLLGQEYRHYYDTMVFWSGVYKDRILHVRYEDMVEDLEAQARRLLGHIGLEFEAGCLDFHRNPNPMRTASALQVRQPLYRTSVDRWRQHRDILQPLYEEINDVVELYERREGLFAV